MSPTSPYLEDGVEDELTEPSDVPLSPRLVPLPLLWAVELVAPQSLHELRRVDLELGRVDFGKLFESEGPAVET